MNAHAFRCGLIGWPVDHSLSPLLHRHASEISGVAFTYELIPVELGRVAEAIEQARKSGMRGLNVTTPHKEVAVGCIDDYDQSVFRLRALNTIVFTDMKSIGLNTDYSGARCLLANLNVQNQTTMIFGRGPAGRAIDCAATDEGFSGFILSSKDQPRAAFLQTASLIVNATPLGNLEHPDESPLPVDVQLNPAAIAIDLNYAQPVTPFMRQAAEQGCRALNGLPLLAFQAADSFNLWTGARVTGTELLEFLKTSGYRTEL